MKQPVGFTISKPAMLAMQIGLAAIIGLALVNGLTAQQNASATPNYTEIKYSADLSSYRWEGNDRILVLEGNVEFVQGDTTLLANRVDYRESTKTANATGNLRIFDDQTNITGEACTVNFEEKKGTMTGSVRMVARPKPTSNSGALASEWKDEVVITCDKIEYFYQEKRAEVPGAVKIVQKTRTVTADKATYRGTDETVQLVGNVKWHDDKDRHSLSSPVVRMSLKEGEEWIEAERATGSFFVKEDAEEEPPADDPETEE